MLTLIKWSDIRFPTETFRKNPIQGSHPTLPLRVIVKCNRVQTINTFINNDFIIQLMNISIYLLYHITIHSFKNTCIFY